MHPMHRSACHSLFTAATLVACGGAIAPVTVSGDAGSAGLEQAEAEVRTP
jgi:hypothetical protein